MVTVDEKKQGEYEIQVAINFQDSVAESFETQLPVTVSDIFGNTSDVKMVDVKIDLDKPEITAINIKNAHHFESDDYGKQVGISDNVLEVDFEVKDNTSGINELIIRYGDLEKRILTSDKKSMQNIKLEKSGDKSRFVVPLEVKNNKRDKLKITVIDNARNGKSYYYNESGKPVEYEYEGSYVIVDRDAPTCTIAPASDEKYTGEDKKRWFSDSPDFIITATDKSSSVVSGINNIWIKVNNIEKTISGIIKDEVDNYKIHLKHDTAKPELVTVFIFDGIQKTEAGSFDLYDTGGRVSVEINCEDAAGNKGKSVSEEIFIDIDAPKTEDMFKVEASSIDNIRKFGSFFNNGVTIKVNTSEITDKPASGLKNAVLEFSGEKHEYRFGSEKNAEAKFYLSFDKNKNKYKKGTVKITVYDNVGNKYTSDILVSEKNNELIVFENNPPEIKEFIKEDLIKYSDAENNIWYNKDVEIKYEVNDASEIKSGLKYTDIKINGKTLVGESYRDEDTIRNSSKYVVNTSDANEADGKFFVQVITEDNAGNPEKRKTIVHVDKTVPEIVDISVEGIGSIPLSIANGIFALPYGTFFASEKEITVYVKDENSSSGLSIINLKLYNFDGSIHDSFSVSGKDIKYSNGIYTASFTVPEGFKGVISADAEDNVKNKSLEKTAGGFVIENAERHLITSSSDILLPETSYTDESGLPLYDKEISAVLSVTDRFSGIKDIEWSLPEYGENIWKRLSVGLDGKINGEESHRFKVANKDNNLVTEVIGDINTGVDMNTNFIRLHTSDNADNTSDRFQAFSIDKCAPQITVSYSSHNSEDVTNNIYKIPRIAYVRVKERNFDSSRIKISINGNAVDSSTTDWSLVEGFFGTDSAVYQTVIEFSEDGEYKFTVDGTDMCDNKADSFISESFVIDMTAPLLEVISDNETEANGKYFSAPKTVKIKITEKTFDPEKINISGTIDGVNESFPSISRWVSDGDIHVTTLNFENDGQYILKINGTDKAGNQLDRYSESFWIDTTMPDIVFSGVKDKSSNKDDVKLSVNIRDTNILKNTVSLTLTGAKRGDVTEKSGKMSETKDGYEYILNEFVRDKALDDIYTLTVFAEDKAGNNIEKEMRFSVNRFGSNYVFDDSTLIISNTYIKKPVDIILHEINADKIDTANTAVKVVKDTENIDLVEGEDYTVNVSGGNGSWYDYEYVISSKNFTDDAAYMVIINSEDKAGNINNNMSDSKNAELRFGVDKTPPRCIPVNIEDNGSYKADTYEVQLVVSDNILVGDILVYLDNNESCEEIRADGSNRMFNIKSSGEPQYVRILTSDKAGNETETIVKNVLVSPSFAKVLVHKTWVRVLVAAAVAGGITAIVLKRRKAH